MGLLVFFDQCRSWYWQGKRHVSVFSESYIYTDPEELPGELLLTPTFCERHGLQPYDYQDQNEPLSKKASNRRLTLHQTKTLERSYSMDNKLEPVLKNKLALELGLQPRQVAIWYQNRRARNKAKSIEGKYAALKLQYQEVVLRNRRLEAEVHYYIRPPPLQHPGVEF